MFILFFIYLFNFEHFPIPYFCKMGIWMNKKRITNIRKQPKDIQMFYHSYKLQCILCYVI